MKRKVNHLHTKKLAITSYVQIFCFEKVKKIEKYTLNCKFPRELKKTKQK